jgi:hypothetical protein
MGVLNEPKKCHSSEVFARVLFFPLLNSIREQTVYTGASKFVEQLS